MKQEQVDTIKAIRDKAAGLIVEVEPQNTAEWDALEKLMEVHKQLRRIDLTKLGQLALLPQEKAADKPMEPVTCPVCNGTKQVVEEQPDADGSGATNMVHVDCPKCRGTGTIPAGQETLDKALEEKREEAARLRAENPLPGDPEADAEQPTPEQQAEMDADKAAFESMGAAREALQAGEAAKAGGSALPIDLSKLHVKVGQEGGRHLIHLNGTSVEGKQLRNTLVKLFQKLNLIERPDQLEGAIANFPDSEGKKIALAVANRTYTGMPHDEGDEQPD